MRRFTFTSRPNGDGCLFADGTLVVTTYSSGAPFEAFINVEALQERYPDLRITWIDPETT